MQFAQDLIAVSDEWGFNPHLSDFNSQVFSLMPQKLLRGWEPRTG